MDEIIDSKQEKQEKYFKDVPEWPNFTIENYLKYSGRIPVSKMESWKIFLGCLKEEDFFIRRQSDLIFRGQRRHNWLLTPSLARHSASDFLTEELMNKQLDSFKKASRGRLNNSSVVADNELWSIGQHYGLDTPLLDWTFSPYVALFFTFEKEDREKEGNLSQYRAIYILNRVLAEDAGVRIFEPDHDEYGRLVAQAGLFTVSECDMALENQLLDAIAENELDGSTGIETNYSDEGVAIVKDTDADILKDYICKIYIKNSDRKECLQQLRWMNIHHSSLFPDLSGASLYCNTLAAENNTRKSTELINFANTTVGGIENTKIEDVSKLHEPVSIPNVNLQDNVFSILKKNKFLGIKNTEISLKKLANKISNDITQRIDGTVYWKKSDAIKAQLRNIFRARLRSSGLALNDRNSLSNQIFELILSTDNEE